MTGAKEQAAVRVLDPNRVQGDLGGLDLLRPFNSLGVLAAADVHTALRLCRMAGVTDDHVALAVALAVRAPRVGHVSVDLGSIRVSAVDADDEVDLDQLPWPFPAEWLERVAASELVAPGDPAGADRDPAGADGDPAGAAGTSPRPLVLAGTSLYLERYWRDEATVAEEILRRLAPGTPAPAAEHPAAPAAEHPATEERLARLFPGEGSMDQLRAARMALTGSFTVIAGGPGTGKTTAVARLLAVLFEEADAAGLRPPLVGLAAPTGKAAARMEEAVRAEATRIESSDAARAGLAGVHGSTLHRLLGTRFDRPGRFRHHRLHRLPHDVVIVDEASMVSLSLMASLIEAVRPDARLVLVGDPEQLVSVEAGAVLADIVGPASRAAPPPAGLDAAADGAPADGAPADGAPADPRPPVAGSICVLRRNHRFAGLLALLSEAVRTGDSGEVLRILAAGDPSVSWVDADPAEMLPSSGLHSPTRLPAAAGGIRDAIVAWASEVGELAAAGDAEGAIAALRRNRILCAHRRGAGGVAEWNAMIGDRVNDTRVPLGGDGGWYAGRPVLVTANDYSLRLFNGDTGVAVTAGGDGNPSRLVVAFDEGRDRPVRTVSPTRLEAVETVYAMTVHKSQGSEFDHVTFLMPPATSRLLTRELLYTAITRARRGVALIGTAEALRVAVETPISRASGLGGRLWGTRHLP